MARASSPEPDQDRDDVVGPGRATRSKLARRGQTLELGHDARTPGEIPPGGWWQVLKRVWGEATSDQILMVAASCAFYATLALFPAMSVLISLYGLLFDPTAIERQLAAIEDVLPAAVFQLVAQRLHDLVAQPAAALSWRLVISVLIALWTAAAGTKALIYALNVAYEEEEKRGLLRFNLTALFFTLCGVMGVAVSLALIVALPPVLQLEALGPLGAIAARLASYAVLLICVVIGLALLYRFAPSRREAHWHWITPGSALAACLWLAASLLFSLYVSHFASYDVTYGSLGAVAVLMLWFYISALVVILGAELNAELELQTRHDTTRGPARPMGQRGAFVADHVAVGETGAT
ncbi:MAG: YihY/virulence factor BrkB family protein [Geminicoccaceae bacterium]